MCYLLYLKNECVINFSFYNLSLIKISYNNVFLLETRESSEEDETSAPSRSNEVNISYDLSLPALHSVRLNINN